MRGPFPVWRAFVSPVLLIHVQQMPKHPRPALHHSFRIPAVVQTRKVCGFGLIVLVLGNPNPIPEPLNHSASLTVGEQGMYKGIRAPVYTL